MSPPIALSATGCISHRQFRLDALEPLTAYRICEQPGQPGHLRDAKSGSRGS